MPQAQLSHQCVLSGWCRSHAKRVIDAALAVCTLMAAAPLMLVIVCAIRATSPGPALFRQRRCGLNGRPFQLMKFRTMQALSAASGPQITRGGDARITRIGRWLRLWKLDELPQFFNVIRGEMSIVGPRPDLEQFWLQVPEAERKVLTIIPGITGAASMAFSNEEEILAQVPQSDLVGFYTKNILPRKARMDIEYAEHATFWSDCAILMGTLLRIFCSPDPAIPQNADRDNEQLSR